MRTPCSPSLLFSQWVTSLRSFWPSKTVPARSFLAKSSRIGTTEQTRGSRLAWPRALTSTGIGWTPPSPGTWSVPGNRLVLSGSRSRLIAPNSDVSVNASVSWLLKSGRFSATTRRSASCFASGQGSAALAIGSFFAGFCCACACGQP